MIIEALVIVAVLAQSAGSEQSVAPATVQTSPGESAESSTSALAPMTRLEKARYLDEQVTSARARRNFGIGSTAAGGVLVAVGVAMIPVAYAMRNQYAQTNGNTLWGAYWGVGAGLAGLGTLAIAMGTVFWASGGSELRHYDLERDKLILGAMVLPTGAGVQVATRW